MSVEQDLKREKQVSAESRSRLRAATEQLREWRLKAVAKRLPVPEPAPKAPEKGQK